VVHTYEVGEVGGSYFIAMEYLDGQPLDHVIRSADAAKMFNPRMWATIACEALSGLHYAHDLCDYDGKPLEIVHRDVSPHNIFLTYDGEVKLVDFGIAKATFNSTRTETGVLKGKVNYMAPEQAGGKVDRRSDLFSMGIVLWEALAGKRLFAGAPLAVLNKLVFEDVPRLSTLRPDIDPRLEAIVGRALSREPEQRFQSAEEMNEALQEYLRATGDPVRRADIGKAVGTMFQTVRESIKDQIHTYMAYVSATADSNSKPFLHAATALPELRGELTISDDDIAAQGSMRSGMAEVRLSPPRRRMRGSTTAVVVFFGAVLVGAIATIALGLRRDQAHNASAPSNASATGAAGARETVELSLLSDPPQASVSWNGSEIGKTPMRVDLPTGAQTLVLSKEGYYPETLIVDLPPGAPGPVEKRATLRAKIAEAPSGEARAAHPKGGRMPAPTASHAAVQSPAAPAPIPSPSGLAPIAPKDSW
jgi:serine/threonine-protein kinase